MIHTDIKACVDIRPEIPMHQMEYITRGASASFNFDLTSKVYTFNDIDQLLFMFRQGNQIYKFTMLIYYKLTEDTSIQPRKTYYEKVGDLVYREIPRKYFGVNPKEKGWFEYSDRISNNWGFDPHFRYSADKTCQYINLLLDPDETIKFKPTEIDDPIELEVAVRLNTEVLEDMHMKDTVIIEPLHPVAVVDSIFRRVISERI